MVFLGAFRVSVVELRTYSHMTSRLAEFVRGALAAAEGLAAKAPPRQPAIENLEVIFCRFLNS